MKKHSSNIYIFLLVVLCIAWLYFFILFKFFNNLKWNEVGDALNIFTSLISAL